MEGNHRFDLLYRVRTRAGWLTVAAGSLLFAFSSALVLIGGTAKPVAIAVTLGFGGGYAWLGLAALDLGRARTAAVFVTDEGMTIIHDGLLEDRIQLAWRSIGAIAVDTRPHEERRIAADTRRRIVAPASFLDPRHPVIGASPSSHTDHGNAVTPNVAVILTEPVDPPPVRLAVRALLRISTGKTGRYHGPRPGRAMKAVRFAVGDPAAFADGVRPTGLLATLPRDESFLAPITEGNREKRMRNKLIMYGIGLAVSAIAAATRANR